MIHHLPLQSLSAIMTVNKLQERLAAATVRTSSSSRPAYTPLYLFSLDDKIQQQQFALENLPSKQQHSFKDPPLYTCHYVAQSSENV